MKVYKYKKIHKYKKPYQFKRKKSIFRNRFFGLAILVLVVAGVVVYFGVFHSFFQIKEVQISGNQKVPTENLQNIIENKIFHKLLFLSSKSIFLVNLDEIEKKILEDFPQVAKVNLDREFPDKLTMTIEERKPISIFSQTLPSFPSENLGGQAEEYFFIDAEGIIFEKIIESDFELPKIKTPFLEKEVKLGEVVIEKEKLSQILEIESKLKKDLKIEVSQAIVVSAERLNVKTFEGWEIYFNLKGDIGWQITELGLVLEEKIPLEQRRNLEYIDLRFSKVYYKYR